MEGESGNNFDKSRVLDIKPLRSLMPVFPSTPTGPFPAGFAPFFPFNGPQVTPEPSQQAHAPAPLRSFRPQQENGYFSPTENGDGSSTRLRQKRAASRPRGSSEKKPKKDLDNMLSMADSTKFVVGITESQRDDGDRGVVIDVMMRYDALRRKMSQLEDAKESPNAQTKAFRRADLKACNVLMSKGVRTNMKKRIGAVPGVEIGDIFFFRMEMCLLGLHSPTMGGIDYMVLKGEGEEDPLAVSIVSSGGYGDPADDPDVLIYSGQGGNAQTINSNKQAADQKLERGNLGLERSLHRGNEVRVIRGMKDVICPTSRVYMYDGLYRIQESWVDKGKSGCNVFKYKLIRVPGQEPCFSIWKSIQQWKEGFSSRAGLILPDLTSGAESLPVTLVNEVDDEKGPAYFTYSTSVKYLKPFDLAEGLSLECNCRKPCSPGDSNCSCIRRNGGVAPYTANSVLAGRRPMVHECSPSCPCGSNCKNRVAQTGLKVRLEVFKTKDKGWGLRSWDPIRAGTFICEYAGEVVEKVGEDDDYAFDSTRLYEPFRWNCEPGLIEDDGNDVGEEYELPSPLIISAKNIGNVSRFMNYSCSPNVFWQPVAYEENGEPYVHIGFFAMRHIPPMTELTYDYGISPNSGGQLQGKKKCLCGSPKCRGHFG